MADPNTWLRHTASTDPAGFEHLIQSLPGDPLPLSQAVQRLLVHTDCLALYGLDPDLRTNVSRNTLPVHQRLEQVAGSHRLDLATGRPPEDRAIGTCRDFALMFCSFLRTHGRPARVRCGFASYFSEDWWDHWICEYWDSRRASWTRADPELDEVMCEACNITFDVLDMPAGAFLSAGEAWLACRAGNFDPETFGHGENKGLWFMSVNVIRDSLSLSGQQMSPWDRWREADLHQRTLSDSQLLHIDELARLPERDRDAMKSPPWLALSQLQGSHLVPPTVTTAVV